MIHINEEHEKSIQRFFVTQLLFLTILFAVLWYSAFGLLLNLPRLAIYVINILFILSIVVVGDGMYIDGIEINMQREYEQIHSTDRWFGYLYKVMPRKYYLVKLVPYKAILFVIYTFVILLSNMNKIEPGIISDPYLNKFISLNEYSVVILIAVDRIFHQTRTDYNRFFSDIKKIHVRYKD